MRQMQSDIRFRRMFEAHSRAIQLYCGRRLQAADAGLAASEVFVVAWKRIDDVPAEPDTLPWLYGVARNVVRNLERSTRRRSRLSARAVAQADAPAASADMPVVQREEHRLVHEALAGLKETDRHILTLHAWEDLSAHEIAVALDISVDAAHMRLNRARKRLARELDRAGYQAPDTDHPRAMEGGGR